MLFYLSQVLFVRNNTYSNVFNFLVNNYTLKTNLNQIICLFCWFLCKLKKKNYKKKKLLVLSIYHVIKTIHKTSPSKNYKLKYFQIPISSTHAHWRFGTRFVDKDFGSADQSSDRNGSNGDAADGASGRRMCFGQSRSGDVTRILSHKVSQSSVTRWPD